MSHTAKLNDKLQMEYKEIMETVEQQPTGTMDQLLKRVYAVHKDALKGMSANLNKCKTAYTKAVEKYHQLQRINDELVSENRKLSTIITTKQNRDGSCCEVIRQSLDTVITSYKQMLADKDARINQLEDEVNRLRRSPGNSTTEQLCMKSSFNLPKPSPHELDEQNPDSTSCVTPKESKQIITSHSKSLSVFPEDDLVFDTSLDDAVKLKLNRKRNKRSRYSEEVSPEHKKPRQLSPATEITKSSDINKVQNKDNVDEHTTKTTLAETTLNSKRNEHGRNVKGKKHKVLVTDTCAQGLDESCVGIDFKRRASRNKPAIGKRKQFDSSVLVVPETLAVDLDDTIHPEDDEADGKFEPELTDISECCEESITLNAADNEAEKQVETDIENYNIQSKKTVENANKSSEKNKGVNIPDSFRNILNSSGSETSGDKGSESNDLDLDSESLVKDSDDESFFDSLPNSQTFVKSKSKGKFGSGSLVDTERDVRNTCKNIKEVDALFETPVSKGSQNKVSDKSDKDTWTRKPLFNKGKKESLQEEQLNEVILRRSPRKHKPSITNNSPKTPTKVRVKLDKGSTGNSPKLSKKSNIESEFKRSIGVNESEEIENDLTIAPEVGIDHGTEGESDNENETLDCYNVMPIKDGNVIPSRKFQVKVKGIKRSNDLKPKTDALDAQIVGIHDETLRSPSILTNDCRPDITGGSEVIIVNSSGSKGSSKDDGNSSDVESPLIIKTDPKKEQIDDDLEIVNWTSAKSKRKNNLNNSQNLLSLSTKRRSLRSSQGDNFKKPGKDFVGKTRKSLSKDVHQTTLTQGFFSPKRNTTRRKDSENVAHNNRKIVNRDAESSVLRELKDQGGNEGGGGKLNGSLDPSAELSEWCRDPETLPSLDTDFCEADLQRGDNSPPRTSTMMMEDTQDIPCSSTSYKFLPKKLRKKNIENIDPQKAMSNMDDSFDRLPKTKGSDIAHVAVVRKRDERQKLPGHGCKECLQYYKSAGRSDEEIKQHMYQCSRHRAQYVPPDTPPHFWSVGFIETQENDNTVLKEDEKDMEDELDVPSYRRRKKLNKYFRSKNENSVVEDDLQNTQ